LKLEEQAIKNQKLCEKLNTDIEQLEKAIKLKEQTIDDVNKKLHQAQQRNTELAEKLDKEIGKAENAQKQAAENRKKLDEQLIVVKKLQVELELMKEELKQTEQKLKMAEWEKDRLQTALSKAAAAPVVPITATPVTEPAPVVTTVPVVKQPPPINIPPPAKPPPKAPSTPVPPTAPTKPLARVVSIDIKSNLESAKTSLKAAAKTAHEPKPMQKSFTVADMLYEGLKRRFTILNVQEAEDLDDTDSMDFDD